MNSNSYKNICDILLKAGRRDLIEFLENTSGASMMREIVRVKALAAENNSIESEFDEEELCPLT